MNYKLIAKTTGTVLLVEAASMIPSLLICLGYGEDPKPFVFSIAAILMPVLFLTRLKPRSNRFMVRDGFVTVSIIWIVMSFFGALPFFFCGCMPSFFDCLFESASGFSTTGATVLANVEALPKGILFWRSFTHWIGGMGILVLTLALFKSLGEGAHHLMRAESPGPSPDKLVARLGKSSKILYGLYVILTLVEIIALKLAGLNLFDASTTSLATAGTGGFAVLNSSIAGYANPAAEIIVTIFMVLFGVNFSMYYLILKRKFHLVWKNSELRLYLGIFFVSGITIGLNLYANHIPLDGTFRHSFFQVASIMTTTGFATTDFNIWPTFSRVLLVFLMFIGACSGSTGGGIKCTRIYILLKSFRRECQQLLHPNSVTSIKIDDHVALSDGTVRNIAQFFFAYMIVITCGTVLVSFDNFDLITTVTSVISCMGNVGPGLEIVGPTGHYGAFSSFSKFVLSACMIIGRLEIFPILLLFSPKTWKTNR